MPADQTAVLATVEAIYDAAAAPELWPAALGQIGTCVDALGAVLQDQHEDGSFAIVSSAGLQAATDAYLAGWWRQDVRASRAVERGLLLARGYVQDSDLVTPEEQRTLPFFADFMPRHGLGPSLGVVVQPATGVVISLGVQRRAGAPAYGRGEIQQVQQLAGYVEKALRLSMRLFDGDTVVQSLGGLLSRTGTGVVLLDVDQHVIFTNAAAERVLGKDMQVSRRRLTPKKESDRARLDAELTAALRDDGVAAASQRVMMIHGNGGQKPLILHIVGVANNALGSVLGSFRPLARLAVLLMDLDDALPLDPAAIRALFDLTPAEARLAALIGAGKSPRAAAVELKIKEQTARVVLKKVFGKAQVSRQGDLAALVSRVSLRDQ